MLNRRHLRVKAFQAIYSWFQTEGEDINKIEKDALKSCLKTLELYVYLISVFLEILHLSRLQIEKNKAKRLPTDEDLNPNLKFTKNLVLNKLEANKGLQELIETRKLNWSVDQDLMRKFYKELLAADFYKEYMAAESTNTFEEDKELVLKMFEQIITPSETLGMILEEKNVHWYDDMLYVKKKILKSLEVLKPSSADLFIVPNSAFKDQDDIDFFKDLIKKTITNNVAYQNLIKEKAKNWEYDRIALNDRILLMMGVCEFENFASIPVKVTMNEYLDLARLYSTEKSNQFINGLLDRILADFNKNKTLKKSGRGLLD